MHTQTSGKESTGGGKRGGRRTPEGHRRVAFYLSEDSYNALEKKAHEDDRKPDDYARTIVNRHVRGESHAR